MQHRQRITTRHPVEATQRQRTHIRLLAAAIRLLPIPIHHQAVVIQRQPIITQPRVAVTPRLPIHIPLPVVVTPIRLPVIRTQLLPMVPHRTVLRRMELLNMQRQVTVRPPMEHRSIRHPHTVPHRTVLRLKAVRRRVHLPSKKDCSSNCGIFSQEKNKNSLYRQSFVSCIME